MITVLTLLLGMVVVGLITVATGYFVAQEFAYMAVDRSRLASLSESGDTSAKRALAVTRRTSFMLSGAQLGITVTGLLVGYAAEPLIGRSLGTMLGDVGVSTAVALGLGAVLALVFSTLVQMLFGELFPKNLAIAEPMPVALRLAGSTTLYLKLMGWLITFFDKASNALLRLLHIEPVHDVEHSASARDLEHIVADSRESGDLPDELSVLIDRILDFPSRDVEHAMIPRARVDTVSDEDSIGEVRALMAAGHSRYPVLAEETDAILGIVRLADVLSTDRPDTDPVASIQKSALIIPTLMRLPDALATLTTTSNQLACVVDEYGGFAGVLTIEDLAEELVGEITDEHDPATQDDSVHPPTEDGSWLMAGDVHIDEFERALDLDVPRGDYETVSGLVIAAHGGLPAVGTTVEVDVEPDPGDLASHDEPTRQALRITVLAVHSHVPARVRVTLEEVTPPLVDEATDPGAAPDHDGEDSP